jgi:hypothetical protein
MLSHLDQDSGTVLPGWSHPGTTRQELFLVPDSLAGIAGAPGAGRLRSMAAERRHLHDHIRFSDLFWPGRPAGLDDGLNSGWWQHVDDVNLLMLCRVIDRPK